MSTSGPVRVEVDLGEGRTVVAEYSGGAYIDLTFVRKPSEVINVWDYKTGRATIPRTAAAVAAEVSRWAAEHDEDTDWPDWFGDYVRNARWS